jgi:hypothetical protein
LVAATQAKAQGRNSMHMMMKLTALACPLALLSGPIPGQELY